jgi:hypothetical protein
MACNDCLVALHGTPSYYRNQPRQLAGLGNIGAAVGTAAVIGTAAIGTLLLIMLVLGTAGGSKR